MIKIKLKGLEKGKEKTIEKSQEVLMKSMFKMEEIAVRKSPFDRGFLRQNITTTPEILSSKYTLRSKAPYSADLEYGNNPRDVKESDIEAWIKRKSIATSPGEIASATRYITEKIRTKGVNAQPFMRPAFFEVINFWYKRFKKEVFQ